MQTPPAAPITLRTAETADREGIIDLIHALNTFEAGLVQDRRSDRLAAREYYYRVHERIAAQHGRIVLAVEAEDILGLLVFVIGQDEPFVIPSLRRYGLVTDLVVAEGARRRGIGRRLLEEAERLTREQGLKRLMIGVLEANTGAHAAYEAKGFRDYMRVMEKSVG